MTRAREELVLTHAADYGGRTRRKMSRFVAEALGLPAAPPGRQRLDPREAIERFAPAATAPAMPRAPLRDDELLRLSSSRIDDYLTCPLKYRYAHEVQVPLTRSPVFMYGDAVHNAIRVYYQHRLRGDPIVADDVVQVFEQAWSSEGFISREHEERRLAQGREALRRFVAREEQRPLTALQVEQTFKFRRGNDVVEGRWDRIDERGGGIVIVDFKTAQVVKPEDAAKRARESLRDSQLGLYALAYREARGITPAAVELHFVESGLTGTAARRGEAPRRRARARGPRGRGHPRGRLHRPARVHGLRLLPLQQLLPLYRHPGDPMTDLDPRALRDAAAELARAAGAILREGHGRAHAPERKGRIDLVTEYDRRSERLVLDGLRRRFPGHAVLAEESGAHAGDAGEVRWIVDPLDGTTNFAHNYPFFCVSIAAEVGGRLAAGVVYDPIRDELFAAAAGHGATRNGEPIRVSDIARVEDALLVTGFPYDVREHPERSLPHFAAFLDPRAGGAARRLGGAQPLLPRLRALRRVLGGAALAVGRGGRHAAGARGRRDGDRLRRRRGAARRPPDPRQQRADPRGDARRPGGDGSD